MFYVYSYLAYLGFSAVSESVSSSGASSSSKLLITVCHLRAVQDK